MKHLTLVLVLFFCSSSLFAQDVLMHTGTVNQCSGILYDSGGASASYSDNENFVLTICPDASNQLIQLDFNQFSTQGPVGTAVGDVLTIYDGNDTTATVLGSYFGGSIGTIPQTVMASLLNTTGCITLEFISNSSGNTTGWAADISCLQSCQTITPTIDSTNPVANGAGIIQIPAGATVDFTGSATFSEDGTGATYSWNFGDATAEADGQSVSHQFNTLGTYTTTFTTTDTNPLGCSESTTITVEILSPYIDVDTTTYTVTQLVEDVLIGPESSPCAQVSNVISSSGDNFGSVSSIGSFTALSGVFINDPEDPDAFTAGVILSSGSAVAAEGPESGTQSAGNNAWAGDADLEAAVPGTAGNPNDTRNASYIQFDFVPTVTTFSFDFIFASEEYGNFQCAYTDSFAFLLTNQTTGVTTNLAIVPGTTDVVSVLNVRDDMWNDGCASANSQFFDSFYGVDGLPMDSNPTNFLGYTVPMTAISSVVPNNTYTIKLVVADDGDNLYDAAVFLGAGSFDLGGDLGNDITIEAGTAGCQGTVVTLDTSLVGATHTWYLENVVIPGETGPTLAVTQEGNYSVDIFYSTTCQTSDSILIEFLPSPTVGVVNNLTECNNGSGAVIFDLTENDALAIGTQDPATIVLSYHNSQADADADMTPITNQTMYNGTDGEMIYIRIEDADSGICFSTGMFLLQYLNIVLNPAPDMEVCDDTTNDGMESFDLTNQDATILGTQTAANFNITYYLDFANADAGTSALTSPYTNTSSPQPIFVRIENVQDSACYIASPTAVFNLVVNPNANATQPMDIAVCDDASNDGIEIFDLTALESDILNGQDPANFTVSFYELQINVATSTSPIPNPATYTNTGSSQPIYVRVDNTLNPTCFGETSFNIIVNPNDNSTFTMQPTCDGATVDSVVTPGGTYVLNPIPTDGATIDAATGTVIGGISAVSYTVDYTTNGTCPSTSSITVTVDTTNDATFTMMANCDGGLVTNITTAGGTFAFNPMSTDGATIDAATGTVIGGTSATAYTVEYSFGGTCPSSTTVVLTVLTTDDSSFTYTPTCGGAIISTVATAGGTFTFNTAPTGGAIIDSATGTITGGTPGTAYIVDYLTNGTCFATSTVTVTVNPLPTVVVPTPLEVCDDNTPDGLTAIDLTLKSNEISGGNPAYAVTYYLTQADADAAASPLANPYLNITNPQTVFVRVENINTGCYDTTTLGLVVEQAPAAFPPTALEYCDPDSDGFGVFTLTDATTEITGGASGVVVTYHETMADAQNNVNALASPYNNIVLDMQTIYIRVESSTIATDCATFVALTLIVNETPQIPTDLELTPLAVCDDATADGITIFDLTTKELELLNLLDTDVDNDIDSALHTITYYETEVNAETPINAIATPNAYTSTTQTIWVRVENNATGCYKTVALDLIVNPLPVLVQPEPLELCDYNDLPGETSVFAQEEFTLEDANAEILNGNTGITLTYFNTQAGATTNDAAEEIFSPYTNTINAQTIYVRAQNNVTGCVNTITLDLRVNPLPSPVEMPLALEACDDDNDGFFDMFDLDSQSVIIANSEPDISISYYETQADAMSMTNSLASPYMNVVPHQQTIYVLAKNDITDCFTIVTMDLVVLPSPVVPIDIDDYVICDDENGSLSDGFNQFNFDVIIAPQIFTGTQTAADFTLSYHLSQADADTGNSPILNTSDYTNLASPQTIYIRLVSIANGCVTTGSFVIRVAIPPVLDSGYDNELAQCDDLDANYMVDNDGFTIFDLTVEDIEITGVDNISWVVTYYETAVNAQADIDAIADPTAYTNTALDPVTGAPVPQTLYIRITDNDTGCFSFTTVTIRVLPNPSPTSDAADLELCDDVDIVGPNDLLEVFDLTQNEAFIINGEPNITASYYITQDAAIMGNNAIVDPTMHTNEDPSNPGVAVTPQTIYVRLTNGTDPTGLGSTGCYSLEQFDVIVNPLPVVTPVTDYVICELNTDDVADFDLTTMTAEILNGQDSTVFTVTYHETQAEADTSMNDLSTAGLYTSTSNPQTIYVNITNTVTGCDTTLSFNLRIDEAAQANPYTFEVCDDAMEFDGDTTNDTTAFNLQNQNLLDQVLNGQDPITYTISYYATQADADAETNPLPFNYTNTVNPQVIFVRVDNDIASLLNPQIDLATVVAPGLDIDGNGSIDTIDMDADGVFDIIDTNHDNENDGLDFDMNGLIDAIDVNNDGYPDLIDLDGNGSIDNDSSICYETAEITLQVNPIPSFNLDATYLICINTNGTEVINSPIIDTELDPALYTFEWSLGSTVLPGETGPSITPLEGGSYTVVVTDTSTSTITMCSGSDTTLVEISEPPMVDATITTLAFADQHNILVTATGTTMSSIAVYEFSIDGGSWEMNTPNDSTYTFTDVAAGEHSITVRDTLGCGETTTSIMVMDYPHYFTPNGDGYHDTWNIYNIGTQPDAVIYIFDRYGKLLKQLSPTGAGWNGTYNGNPMPTSDYWFTVEYREPSNLTQKKTFRAHFTLKR